MLGTIEAENRHLDMHTEPQLKKRCAYKKKKCIRNVSVLSKFEIIKSIKYTKSICGTNGP